MSRPRVLHVGKYYAPHRGGIETYLELLCRQLQGKMDVEVLVANAAGGEISEVIDGTSVTRLKTWFHVASQPVCPALVRKIRESKADLIHLHFPNPLAVAAYLASGQKAPLIVTYHSDIVRQKFMGRLLEPLLRLALDRSAAVIVTSPNYLDSSPLLPGYRDRCRVIPLGIDLQRYQTCDGEAVSRIRSMYGPRIALSVGRLVYYKGFEHLIEAMAKVNGHLLIIGGGPLYETLKRKSRDSSIGGRVTLLGEIADAVPYFQAADLFVLASTERSEAFGIVQLEAMACAKPVVNTRIPSGVPYVSVDQVTGLTVAPADAMALAEAMNQLLDDPVRSQQYGQAGRRRVSEHFRAEKIARQTLELYGEVTGRKIE